MTNTLLDYAKIVIEKVSFNAQLFEKELNKAVKVLDKVQVRYLKKWCLEKYKTIYEKIIQKVFAKKNIVLPHYFS